MNMIANPGLLAAGLTLLVIGIWVFRRAGRYSAVDAATDAAWDAVKARDMGRMRDHLEGQIKDVAGAGSVTGGAKKLAGMAAREAFSRVLRVAGLFAILSGLILAAAGIYWH